ncbi:hypothetical protein [Micromonospora musae]|uniref:hypothetical protein n=1 Tax=Micromonospora musae TaxID=1894970 RepID=UPI0011C36410|nr:hypothetical protein [Micromonospora musae]
MDIDLQAYWCDPLGCPWVTVASGSGDYLAGGGSGRRSNARTNCSSSATVGWQGATDIDLNGTSLCQVVGNREVSETIVLVQA